jgi:pectate lyase
VQGEQDQSGQEQPEHRDGPGEHRGDGERRQHRGPRPGPGTEQSDGPAQCRAPAIGRLLSYPDSRDGTERHHAGGDDRERGGHRPRTRDCRATEQYGVDDQNGADGESDGGDQGAAGQAAPERGQQLPRSGQAALRVASNKTILGVGSNSGTNGCGFNLRDASNIVIRNLRISNVKAGNGNGDAIHLDNSTRVWIDHNDLSSNTTSGTDFYDGLLDITHASDYVTVSWNILHDHIKCSLVGHSDSNASEDTGHLRVTYHHNEFSNCAERNPRVRFGNPVHVFNNYYVNTVAFDYSYGIATTENAGVLVEGNYFEHISDPTHIGEGSSDPGSLVARNNTLVNSGPVLTSGSVASIPYAYTVDPSANVKSIVTSGAGVGKITT